MSWLFSPDYPDRENRRWRLTRSMRRDREDIWNHCLPTQDSFWVRWKNRMWRVSRDCLRQFPSTRSQRIGIPVPQSEPLQRFTTICVFYMRGSVYPIAQNAAERSKNRRWIRWLTRSWSFRKEQRYSFWRLWSEEERDAMKRFWSRPEKVDTFV